MSEGSSSIAITQRINAGHIGAKLIINLDVTALIYLNPGLFQTEAVGIRHSTDSEKHMRAHDNLIAAAAINLHGHFVVAFFKGDTISPQTDLDAFAFENRFDVFGNILVFTVNQSRPPLHNGDLTAEAAVHLSKLQSHGALTDHGVFAHFDFFHVNGDRAGNRDAVIVGPTHDMSCARTRHQRLRWDAAVIDTGAAEPLTLDNSHLHSCVCQPNCERRSCLASANNDRIIFSCYRHTSARVTVVYNFQGSYQPLRATCTLRLRKFAHGINGVGSKHLIFPKAKD